MPLDSDDWKPLTEDELQRAYERGIEDQRTLNQHAGVNPEYGTHEAGLRYVAAAALMDAHGATGVLVSQEWSRRMLQVLASHYYDPEVL